MMISLATATPSRTGFLRQARETNCRKILGAIRGPRTFGVLGPALTVATIEFLVRGGEEYPYWGASFTILEVSYKQALANYIQDPGGPNGTVTADDNLQAARDG